MDSLSDCSCFANVAQRVSIADPNGVFYFIYMWTSIVALQPGCSINLTYIWMIHRGLRLDNVESLSNWKAQDAATGDQSHLVEEYGRRGMKMQCLWRLRAAGGDCQLGGTEGLLWVDRKRFHLLYPLFAISVKMMDTAAPFASSHIAWSLLCDERWSECSFWSYHGFRNVPSFLSPCEDLHLQLSWLMSFFLCFIVT